ncbi:hypothetical protein ACFL1Y_00550 [Patescibacteria group bacterium]
MAVEVKRKSNENTYGLMMRFKDKVKKGRVLSLAKSNSCFQKKKSKFQQKKDALRRQHNKQRREFLIKTGKITEETMNNGTGRFNKK